MHFDFDLTRAGREDDMNTIKPLDATPTGLTFTIAHLTYFEVIGTTDELEPI